MSLLAILISLLLEKLLPPLHGLRSLAWVESYHQWVHTRLAGHKKWQGIPSLLIIILLPLAGVAATQYLLNELLGILGFIFSIIVLTYSLGPKDKRQLAYEYLNAEESGDNDNAESMLQDIVSCTTSSPLPEDKTSRTRALIECILIQTHEQLLAILFWFVILGPMGAALYRLTVELHQAEQRAGETAKAGDAGFRAAVIRLHYLLAWIPSRLTALSYAVMGSFVHALHAWQNTPLEEADTNDDTTPQSHRLLLRIGQASLQFGNHPSRDDSQHNDAIRETLGLCGRSLVAWVTVLALMTLAGWAS
ncbi:MAG TPA: regulatory signaling modulator protein AmpE [Gammaproteobacteria bacterium]|nr:regulatory signaling modulator protein AmpE [Gammaproteobacteria bacterium]